MKLNEMTLEMLGDNTMSNITKLALNTRELYGDSGVRVKEATINRKEDFLEVIFLANSTNRTDDYLPFANISHRTGKYNVVFRFYRIDPFISKAGLMSGVSYEIIRTIIQNCDVKLYSDDPSWYYQGAWLDAERSDLSIYKCPVNYDSQTWHYRHNSSGNLINPNIHITKHMGQIIKNIKKYIADIANKVVVV